MNTLQPKRFTPARSGIEQVIDMLAIFLHNWKVRRSERIEKPEFHPDDLARLRETA